MLKKIPPRVARISLIAIFLMIWEFWARKFGDPLFISPPSRVLFAIFHLGRDKEVVTAVGLTCWELVVAFALSVLIGLTTGLIVGLHRFTRGAMYPIILLLYATPLATILPLFVVVFGIGPASKIAFGVCHGVFPVIMTVVAGVQNIEPILLTSARSMGASRRQILFSVIFPAHDSEFFHRPAVGDDRGSFWRAAGRAVCLASGRRPLHDGVRANISAAKSFRIRGRARCNCRLAERTVPVGGITIQPLARIIAQSEMTARMGTASFGRGNV